MKFLVSIIFVTVVLGAIEALNNPQDQFEEFIKKYDRHYKTNAEYRFRYKHFLKNLNKIKQLQESEEGSAIYGINQFSDFTADELSRLTGEAVSKNRFDVPKPSPWPQNIPVSFDWRENNAVTEVKDQNQCGKAAVFSVVANIEGLYAIKYGNLTEFSEQQIMDCDPNGGPCAYPVWPYEVYPAVVNMGGLETEANYPYVDQVDICDMDKSKVVASINGYQNLTNDETELAEWLYKNGPVTAVINADPFVSYTSGIIDNQNCQGGKKHLSHTVVLVGYGTENNVDYWIVKNSWGVVWGEQGYARLARGLDMCGVAEGPSSAFLN